ncbi:hypothetical protein DPM19_01240 [Actinomadura craniellae]|uniref:Uncharacterized protein n=1 Tax=Actinomadura craniellae TaxID=2231787 RepID=A0A365HCF2_9ACTN|nr:hypothetical protein DPM19_01240 [Actinomadura craniellae]
MTTVATGEATAASAVRELRARFPAAVVWFGPFTGRWWAMVGTDHGPRLVEAITPAELGRAIASPAAWPWPRPTPRGDAEPERHSRGGRPGGPGVLPNGVWAW